MARRPRHRAPGPDTNKAGRGPPGLDTDRDRKHRDLTHRSPGPSKRVFAEEHRASTPTPRQRRSPTQAAPGPDTRSAGPDTKSAGPRRAPTLRARAGPRHKECRAPTERVQERTGGPRHKAPGPDTQKGRRAPTQSAGPQHSEGGRAMTQSAWRRHKERRAPTLSPAQSTGPDTKSAGPRHKEGAPHRALTAINMVFLPILFGVCAGII